MLTKTFKRIPILRIVRPFQEFVKLEASGGILLLACTVLALAWANSPWGKSYVDLWHTQATIGIGGFILSKDLLHWINDGLMVVFFFVVGLEIKREVLAGELASAKKAALPIAAALGGMIVPAAIYSIFNAGGAGAMGWGIPMATDIAFALGALTLLGNRVPLALKVFLTALAIVDDIGAVLVIALFYTTQISWLWLFIGGIILLALIVANQVGVRSLLFYTLLGIGLWLAFLQSGIHTTIAGVLLAMTIPARARIHRDAFLERSRALLSEFEQASGHSENILTNPVQQAALQELETACEQTETPLQRFEHALHPWVTFTIMPIFALANAGVTFAGDVSVMLIHPVSIGVAAGLVLGKQLGITLFTWLAVKSRLAVLPNGITWKQIYGVGWLGGIGFTMSLFIATLAFDGSELLTAAKLGILTASLLAGIVGWMYLARNLALTPAADE